MLNFNSAVEALLGNLGAEVQVIPINPRFEEFKQFAIQYVQEHDELPHDHQTIQQIANMNSIDEIEQLLRHNHEYCEECILKMFRRFASGEQQDSGCRCGG